MTTTKTQQDTPAIPDDLTERRAILSQLIDYSIEMQAGFAAAASTSIEAAQWTVAWQLAIDDVERQRGDVQAVIDGYARGVYPLHHEVPEPLNDPFECERPPRRKHLRERFWMRVIKFADRRLDRIYWKRMDE